MKDFLVNRKKEIILVSILLVFAVILVIVIINKDKIDFASLMGNNTISSEYEYYCEDGWELINYSEKKFCSKWVGDIVDPIPYCPEGYEQSEDKCIKTVEMEYRMKCPEGTEFIGATAEKDSLWCAEFTRKKAKVIYYKKETPYTTPEIKYGCDTGWTLDDKTCKKIIKEMPGEKEYYCPEGYEQSGDKCIKTVKMRTKCPGETEFAGSTLEAKYGYNCQERLVEMPRKRNVKISKSSPY